MFTIKYDEEVEEFIESLQEVSKSKLTRLIRLLVAFGPDLGMPHSRRLTNRLFELRIRGAQEIRFFYFEKKRVIIVLHSFKKKTQEIPSRELEKAKKLLIEHI